MDTAGESREHPWQGETWCIEGTEMRGWSPQSERVQW